MTAFTGLGSSKKVMYTTAALVFWAVVWYAVSAIVNKPYLLASPVAVLKRLWELGSQPYFWRAATYSIMYIFAGFILAVIIAVGLAMLCSVCKPLKIVVSPAMNVIKATPVASFVILALVWFDSSSLALITSFLLVLPVIYANVLQGIYSRDKKLMELAEVYKVSLIKRIIHSDIQQIMPYFTAGCSVGLGFCWKAGIAAEVIGQPRNRIGWYLNEAKVQLENADLLAWTLVVIIISMIIEKAFIRGLKYLANRVGGNSYAA